MAHATAQINVRLDKQLKQWGDAALAEIGLSPSDAVRALWGKAAQRGKALEEIRRLLFSQEEGVGDSGADALVLAGWALADQFYASAGYSHEDGVAVQPWDELYQAAMDEHFAQEGLFS